MKYLTSACFKALHFSLSSGVHGGKTINVGQRRLMAACIAIRSGTKCQPLHKPSDPIAPISCEIVGRQMVEKRYSWENGAILEEHSKRKHKIVREYFARYLAVRCQLPMQSKFRLAIVDGFAGGGRYKCGSPGSPIIFIEELRLAAEELNVKRQSEGMAPLDIECFLILNDFEPGAINTLEGHLAPILAEIIQNV